MTTMIMMTMLMITTTGGKTERIRGARCQRPAGGKTQIRSFRVNYGDYDDDDDNYYDDDDVVGRNDGDDDNNGCHNANQLKMGKNEAENL